MFWFHIQYSYLGGFQNLVKFDDLKLHWDIMDLYYSPQIQWSAVLAPYNTGI